ncbi:MAG: ABC-2 transporter permease [Clostridia bacterium]
MNRLLQKELRLAMHPASVGFLLLSALLLIPNYPYYVTFFYTSLGVFFICLGGRENKDVEYSLLLPVGKTDAVKARFMTVLLLELGQMLLAVPFAVLRQQMSVPLNQVGIEANLAFFGFSFVMLGLFNLIFFLVYYKDVRKVGKAFVVSSTVVFFYAGVMETLTHIVPFFAERMDTLDPQFLTEKLVVLVVGFLLFALLTFVSYRLSLKNFERQDI